MTFHEALAILGIDTTVGKKGARRAYLKLIKVHKPDRDPDMFRRVREAYERVKDEIEYYAPRPTTPPPEPVPPELVSPEPERVQPSADAFFESVLERTEGYETLLENRRSAERVAVDPRVEPPIEIETRSTDGPLLDAHASEPPRVDLHAADPINVETHSAHPLRIEVHSEPPPEPEARAEALDARPLVFDPPPRYPRVVPPAELLAAAWAVFNESGKAKGVDDLALQAFDAAHAEPELEQPSAYDAIHLCLALFSAGRIIAARRVTRAMRSWLSETGLERQVMGGRLAATLAVLQAFLDLPADTPSAPIEAIALATRGGDLQDAVPRLRTFVRDSPFTALVSADRFRDHAPLLSGMFGEVLRTAQVQLDVMQIEDAPPAKRSGCAIIFYLMLACFGIGVLAQTCDDRQASQSSRFRPPSIQVPSFKPVSVPSIDLSKMRELSRKLAQSPEPLWLRMQCPEGAEEATAKCAAAEILYEAIEAQQCDQAVLAYTRLARIAQGDPVVQVSLSGMKRSLVKQCPSGQDKP